MLHAMDIIDTYISTPMITARDNFLFLLIKIFSIMTVYCYVIEDSKPGSDSNAVNNVR